MKKITLVLFLIIAKFSFSQKKIIITPTNSNKETISYNLTELKKKFPELLITNFEINYNDAFSLFYNQGVIVYEDYYPKKAILYFNEALRYYTDIHVLNKLGNSYADLKMYNKAIDSYKRMLEIDEYELVALTNIGVQYVNLNNYDKAIEYYLKAYKIDNTDERTLSGLGNSYAHKRTEKDYIKAIYYYKKVLEIEENLHVVWNNLGTIYTLREKPDKKRALECYNKSLEIEPFFPEAILNKADYYYQKKEYKKALENINKSISVRPTYINAWSLKAQIYSAIKDYENTIITLKKIIKLTPKDVITRIELIELLVINNRFKEANYELSNINKSELNQSNTVLFLFHEYILNLIASKNVLNIKKEITKLYDNNNLELNWSFGLIKEWLSKNESINTNMKEKIHQLISQLNQ